MVSTVFIPVPSNFIIAAGKIKNASFSPCGKTEALNPSNATASLQWH